MVLRREALSRIAADLDTTPTPLGNLTRDVVQVSFTTSR
jgi:hypothetical protein